MSMAYSGNLLDEALGHVSSTWNPRRRFLLIEDFVETSGAFVLHQLAKNALAKSEGGEIVVFLAFAQNFAHYDRVLRKLGCNLSIQREKKRLIFFELLDRQFPGLYSSMRIKKTKKSKLHLLPKNSSTGDAGCRDLYAEIHRIAASCRSSDKDRSSAMTILIDDLSLLEAAAGGSSDHVLDFLHYCISSDSSLIALTHVDIYPAGPTLLSHLHYLADAIIKAEPLRTGSSNQVHGQLTVARGQTFLFRVKENAVEYFYPGTLT
ncbi:elongator protein 6 isoform X1 [Wolffia australiana]